MPEETGSEEDLQPSVLVRRDWTVDEYKVSSVLKDRVEDVFVASHLGD